MARSESAGPAAHAASAIWLIWHVLVLNIISTTEPLHCRNLTDYQSAPLLLDHSAPHTRGMLYSTAY